MNQNARNPDRDQFNRDRNSVFEWTFLKLTSKWMNSSSGLKSRNYIRDKNSRKLRSDQNSRRDIIIITWSTFLLFTFGRQIFKIMILNKNFPKIISVSKRLNRTFSHWKSRSSTRPDCGIRIRKCQSFLSSSIGEELFDDRNSFIDSSLT